MSSKTCGDHGGKRLKDGSPCTRKQGWGTGTDTGMCAPHVEGGKARAERLDGIKRRVLELLATCEHTLRSAAEAAGSSITNLWRMRKEDPEFDRKLVQWRNEADLYRVGQVEDTLYKRLVDSNATAAEMIFYLCNRAKGRWRTVTHIEVAGPDGGPVPLEVTDARERLAGRVASIASRIGTPGGDPRLN